MGDYVYKTTKNTVELANGEKASVAVYAYKPSWSGSDKMHVTSGAAACDRAADKGQRHDWVVMGYKNESTGLIEIDRSTMAKKVGARGSISGGAFDHLDRPQAYIRDDVNPKGCMLTMSTKRKVDETNGFNDEYHFINDGWVKVASRAFKTFTL